MIGLRCGGDDNDDDENDEDVAVLIMKQLTSESPCVLRYSARLVCEVEVVEIGEEVKRW